jgi:predicted phage-related endonuclease
MPSALAFDTHAYVRKLRDVGVPEEQAEVQVEAIASILHDRMVTKEEQQRLEVSLKRYIKELETKLGRDIKELETELKRDIKELETELKRDIKELETKLGRDIKELENRLLVRLGTLVVIGIGVIATLVKLL